MQSKPIWRVAGILHTSEATAFTGVSLMCPNSRMSSSSGVPRVAYALGLLSQVNITTRWMADMGGCGCETDAPHRSWLASAFPARESSRRPIIGKPTRKAPGLRLDLRWCRRRYPWRLRSLGGRSSRLRNGPRGRNLGRRRMPSFSRDRRILRRARMSMKTCWGRFEQ